MDDDPPAALFTNAQRDYLRGEKEYTPSAEREVRTRIRDRIKALLTVDMRLAANAGGEIEAVEDDLPEDEFADGVAYTSGLLWLMSETAGFDPTDAIMLGAEAGEKGGKHLILDRLRENPEKTTIGEVARLMELDEFGVEEVSETLVEAMAVENPEALEELIDATQSQPRDGDDQ